MNFKEEFIKWFFNNANGRYSGLTEYSVSRDMDESLKHLNKDVFEIDESNYNQIRDYLKIELYRKGSDFDNYSAEVGHHRPRAILGKENYLKFLDEKFGSYNYKKSKKRDQKYWLYSPGENAEHWEEFYEKGIMGLGWDYLGDLNQYSSKEEIVRRLQEVGETDASKKNDATACDDFINKMEVGDIIITKKGRRTLLGYGEVSSEYYFDNNRLHFKHNRQVDWKKRGEWDPKYSLITKTLTDITSYPAEVSDHDYFYERLLSIINGGNEESHISKMKNLNTILYGPPGTGKTFRLQDKYFKKFTVKETSLSREQHLENIVSELTWWQVLSVILLHFDKAKVNDIIGHELLLMKGKLSNSKSLRPTIWGRLQAHTTIDCPNVNVTDRSQPAVFFKTEDSQWSVDKELLEQYFPEAFEIKKEISDFNPSPDNVIKNYEFVTFHQSFGYEDFIEGIKPNLGEQENDVSYQIEDGIFKKLCLKADADRENEYAIFIDEISRGNVSAIFGELITLIEEDKRLGEANELRAKLPYSKKELGVPPNLYIFGTMNTADRSVEALDTALRRRFTFEEIMPLPHLLNNISFSGFNLQEVLETINKRIEALLDRDHMIGHSYFIKFSSGDAAALKEAFQNKIIPLLQEYFYHDYEKIALILGEGFIERKEEKVQFATFSQLDDPEILPSFELKKDIEDIEAAVRKLLNRKDETTE